MPEKLPFKQAVDAGIYYCPVCACYHDANQGEYIIPKEMLVAVRLAGKLKKKRCVKCMLGIGGLRGILKGVEPDEG